MLSSLECVDYVLCIENFSGLPAINSIKPHLYFKGGDYKKEDVIGKNHIEQYGGEIIILPLSEGFSTTNILEKIYNG